MLCSHAVNSPLCSQVMNWVLRLFHHEAYRTSLNSSPSGADLSPCRFLWFKMGSQGRIKYVRTQPSLVITRASDVNSGVVLSNRSRPVPICSS
jgi:hypothetical protein